LREVWAGHDGTWVAHPGLIPLAKFVFDTYMRHPNQLDRLTQSATTAADLLSPPSGPITEAGLSLNVDVGLQYLSAWLGGNGCVPIYNLMEDAATAEICRAQLWQWMRHGSRLEDGRVVTPELVGGMVHQHVEKLSKDLPEAQLSTAARLLDEMVNAMEFPQFLTLRAYDHLA
jgi:malate synthase